MRLLSIYSLLSVYSFPGAALTLKFLSGFWIDGMATDFCMVFVCLFVCLFLIPDYYHLLWSDLWYLCTSWICSLLTWLLSNISVCFIYPGFVFCFRPNTYPTPSPCAYKVLLRLSILEFNILDKILNTDVSTQWFSRSLGLLV